MTTTSHERDAMPMPLRKKWVLPGGARGRDISNLHLLSDYSLEIQVYIYTPTRMVTGPIGDR